MKLSTGFMAGVWTVDRRASTREKRAELHVLHMEYRVERARRILQDMQKLAQKTVKDIENAELRFNALKDSFTLLKQEQEDWKQQNDLE